jgi:hypothetical protein
VVNLQPFALDQRAGLHDRVLEVLGSCADLVSSMAALIGLLSAIIRLNGELEPLFLTALHDSLCQSADQPHFSHVVDVNVTVEAIYPPLLRLLFEKLD